MRQKNPRARLAARGDQRLAFRRESASERATACSRSALLDQSLSLHGLFHLGASGNAVDVGCQIGPLAEIDVDARRPTQHGEKIGIGDSELFAHEVLLAGKLLVEPVKALADIF